MSVALAIPQADYAEFGDLPDAVKKEVRLRLRVLNTIWYERPIGLAIASHCAVLGISEGHLRRLYDAYRKTGDWRVLMNRCKAKATEAGLPPEFITEWKSRAGGNQRVSKQAWRELIDDWRAGKVIPGYEDKFGVYVQPLAHGNSGIPFGWSYKNLMVAKNSATKFELTALRIGRSAASEFRPRVMTTRAELRVGQFVPMDDMWHDHKTNLIGQRQAFLPQEFAALDLFSGCRFDWGVKPRIKDALTGKAVGLRQFDYLLFLAKVLATFGRRTDERGTTLIMEHGTTNVPEHVERLLYDQWGIVIQRSGIENKAALVGAYGTKGGGLFTFKAALESNHNLAHNYLGGVAGQVGKDRDHSPEDLAGREKYNEMLLKVALSLPMELASLLRMPFMPFSRFLVLLREVYHRMNSRTDHELEGYREAGLEISEYSLTPQLPNAAWLPMEQLLTLPAPQRAAIEAALDAPDLTRSRLLSPMEVFRAGLREMSPIPPHGIAELLSSCPGLLEEQKVKKNGEFIFQDSAIGAGEFHYIAKIGKELLTPGETFLVKANSYEPSQLFVFDARARFLGLCRRHVGASRADQEAMGREIGIVEAIEDEMLAKARVLGEEVIAERRDAMATNMGLVADPEQLTRAKQKAKAEKTYRASLAAAAADIDPDEL